MGEGGLCFGVCGSAIIKRTTAKPNLKLLYRRCGILAKSSIPPTIGLVVSWWRRFRFFVWALFGRYTTLSCSCVDCVRCNGLRFRNEQLHNLFVYLKPWVGKQKSPTLIQKCLDWRLYFAYSAGWGGVAVLYNFSGAE